MTQQEPIPYQPNPLDQQQSNLNTLSIFYFIIAGLQALGMVFGLIYIGIGVLFGVLGVASAHNAGDAGVGAGFGAIFACFGFFITVVVGIFAFLNYRTAKSLRERKRITLIYVMAAIACLSFPLGTILGVFTFVVLGKPGVKESFT